MKRPPKVTMMRPRVAEMRPRVFVPTRSDKQTKPFYLSPEWRALIADIKRERGEHCEECGVTGVRIFGDHVVELEDGGAPLDPRNVRLLCGEHHAIKTARERARRLQGTLGFNR